MTVPNVRPSTASVAELLFAAGLLALLLCLVGPFGVYVENRAEFPEGIDGAAGWLALATVATAALLVFLALAAGTSRRGSAIAALLVVVVLLWLETALSGRYQLLDGSAIDWGALRLRAIVEVAVWIAALAWALRSGHGHRRLLWILALAVVVVQPLTAVGLTRSTPIPESAPTGGSIEALASLSHERNVLVIVLDGTQSDYVRAVLEQRPALRESLRGFTFYSDHMAAFPTTRFSLPAMLSGRFFDNTRPADDFIADALEGTDSIPRRFQEEGWDVGLASIQLEFLAAPADVRVHSRGVAASTEGTAGAAKLLDLSLFRFGPVVVKRWVFDDNRWRLRRLAGESSKAFHASGSRDFLAAFRRHVAADSPRPAFRFLHVGGAHAPVVVDEECRDIPVATLTPETYRGQVQCALSSAIEVIDRLRDRGLLDSSLIIITADHGAGMPSQDDEPLKEGETQLLGLAAAPLLVKARHAEGPLRFDPTPTSLETLTALLVGELGVAATPPTMPRRFAFYSWHGRDWRQPYLAALHLFAVEANARDPRSWSYLETRFAPGLEPGARRELDFAVQSLRQRFPPTSPGESLSTDQQPAPRATPATGG